MDITIKRELVVVYTVGKVASSTISESIKAAGLQCYDVHVMEHSRLLNVMKTHARDNVFPPPHIAQSLLIRRDFFSKYSNVKLISLIRDCPSRNVSCVFQNLPKDEAVSVEEVSEQLLAMHFNPFSPWFRKELLEVTGIDVMATPFDRDAKWQRYSRGRFELLLMRTDLADDEKSQQLENYLGISVPLLHSNVGAKKWYSELYNRFNSSGELSEKWINSAIDNKFMRHFFHDYEREKLRTKYSSFVRV
ncbi:putative capsular polysaccharide synthesis family protein [uncultured Umboniibacter sp.]|uniref:putative capsular polysaccharide synthesis family protein n=1 Tax=uncultured Umboniibacter sp. TaxID=1798917 RepID=UPI00262374ED|nr:putative capsular polysaccharide synthesis family protein [uncultured Umboniibacter sp.]